MSSTSPTMMPAGANTPPDAVLPGTFEEEIDKVKKECEEHINGLKEKNLWWEEDEKLFQDKYGISSDEAYKKIREGE